MFKKLSFSTLGTAFLLLACSTVAYAAGDEIALAGLKYFTVSVFTAGFAIAFAAFGGSIGQGWSIKNAVEGIARNPESSGKVTVTLLIGIAMIESLVIYTRTFRVVSPCVIGGTQPCFFFGTNPFFTTIIPLIFELF
ncbi:MAG: ATP synthase F0 subunit C [Deltaproteobacteria bacterium]|nr:ATP synthase F0 subunit C [Deltaproteobacteria bacterium]